jgi:hypothetical protein
MDVRIRLEVSQPYVLWRPGATRLSLSPSNRK